MIKVATAAVVAVLIGTVGAHAQDTRISVTIENLAPDRGNFLTPFWVGFHGGAFDTYDGNTPAGSNPLPGSVAMESLCEDGNTGLISQDFAALVAGGVDATLLGPGGPIAPGEMATGSFLLDPQDPANRYFSYASMIIPSNDFCVSNGNPLAHRIFDDQGNFVAQDFFITGSEVLDAGTEVNDELPANTAFFGQQAPNTGVDENGNIGDAGALVNFMGFFPPGNGGILDDPQFAMADFTMPGYPIAKISFTIVPFIVEDLTFTSRLSGAQEVPSVSGDGRGRAEYRLMDNGSRLSFEHLFVDIPQPTMAHLHLAPAGENGPVVAFLFDPANPPDSLVNPAPIQVTGGGLSGPAPDSLRRLSGELTASDLAGPLAGQPLDVLIREILDGNVYINVHTQRVPSGEIRGQLLLDE